jgi:hypothetical protein
MKLPTLLVLNRIENHVRTDHHCCNGTTTGDFNRDGHPDILTASKLETFVFFNQDPQP